MRRKADKKQRRPQERQWEQRKSTSVERSLARSLDETLSDRSSLAGKSSEADESSADEAARRVCSPSRCHVAPCAKQTHGTDGTNRTESVRTRTSPQSAAFAALARLLAARVR